jgi:hypothetical protein
VLFSLLAFNHFATAATLCVNPAGSSGCYSTIGAAVKAAASGDTVTVATGNYAESVTITKTLSLIGAGSSQTIINASGLPNGIYIDGLDNGGLYGVVVTGFTVINANYEGILVTNSSYVVISQNHVASNDQSLNYAAATCPGQPAFETSEGEDCGEGIHLVGVDHSIVANNDVELNSGGILLSDETGYTNDNTISGNQVHDNALDCGITLASHPPSPQAASKLPYGVFHNTITGNNSSGNGLIGIGAGVGIFAPGPGNLNYGNRVVGNILQHNGQPGFTMHNHAAPPGAPAVNLDDNVITGNLISGNGADDADAATAGPAGINVYSVATVNGLVIEGNTIQDETIDVVMNAPGTMTLHLNSLMGGKTGASNTGKGAINASMNYWGCAGGPGTTGCATASGLAATPWLSAPINSTPRGPGGH